ncbi:MAG: zinc-binding alcohol dehydrogenase, partial [Patescibacteria group bacterium]|nr:zinc-binding alcohol dehydrogenase [Patescibacteria group bacterium]
FAKKNLIGKAQERPDLFKAFLDRARRDGFLVAFQQAQRRLEKYMPLGYSSAGIVEAVADDVTEFKVGDRVACAGAEYAWHADKVYVPKNLVVKVPDNADLKEACFATVSSISLNGLRCVSPELGQTIVIIGLGLLGLLTVQLAKSAGCRVVGIDLDERKVKLSQQFGIDLALTRSPENESTISEFTGGLGADAVIITASAESNDPVELAGKIARNRGKISIVGAVGLDIPREFYYKKELSVFIPRSYGPGRYDRNYEEMGHDYPVDFVRWTIARNMQTILNLISEKKLVPSKLVTETIPIDNAAEVYSKFEASSNLNVGMVIQYGQEQKKEITTVMSAHKIEPKPHSIK